MHCPSHKNREGEEHEAKTSLINILSNFRKRQTPATYAVCKDGMFVTWTSRFTPERAKAWTAAVFKNGST